MGIDTVTGHSDDVADFVEKTQRAMHAEAERGNELAARVVELESIIRDAYARARGAEIRRDEVGNLVAEVDRIAKDMRRWASDYDEEHDRAEQLATKLEAEKRANAALREALDAASRSLFSASQRARVGDDEVRKYCANRHEVARDALATDAGKDFVPRAELREFVRIESVVQQLGEAVEHLKYCAPCSEDAEWKTNGCPGGVAAAEALAAYRALGAPGPSPRLREKLMRVAQEAYSAGLSDGHPLHRAQADLAAIVDAEMKL